ncbi:phosphate signaling complex protein PhoU [Inquilinus limosus]|uniref:Phosphate-specific transport system accessory protein PhoU n=1 Tax=Inquilinus limosus TaxID=171674 RepID=A0A211Z1D2_9PROT|nr:phosphate signaling complex protein PhoU [Inquilinus limosus]OWJ59058.1 phosphate transport system regulatory protein PhoU [Inquilinus limosus]
MANEHIVKSFDQELEALRRTIVQMGGLAESQLELAIQAVVRRDADLAGRVMRSDEQMDAYENAVDAAVVQILALRQPFAGDLREVVSALRIASDLERIGDYAANIAKRSLALAQVPVVRPVTTLPRMGRMVQQIIKDVLDAYTERDLDKALAAWRQDESVDDLYTSLFRETLTYMMEDPRNITPCTHLLFIAKNIERIGDHATNIAELIHFQLTGKPVKDARPKGDSTSFTVVTPEAKPEDNA